MPKTTNKWLVGTIAEVAFFVFLYYAQNLLKVEGNLWVSSLVLLVLANIAIAFCPVLGKNRG